MVHDRLRCISCLCDFLILRIFIINKACIQCLTGDKVEVIQSILPCLCHFMSIATVTSLLFGAELGMLAARFAFLHLSHVRAYLLLCEDV